LIGSADEIGAEIESILKKDPIKSSHDRSSGLSTEQ